MIAKYSVSIMIILVTAFVFLSGCTNSNQTGILPQSPQTITPYIPETSDYACFEISGVSEENDLSTGRYGKNIADTRRVSGTIKNNCGKIMAFLITIRWFDENGKAKYYGFISPPSYRLKSGESVNFQSTAYHSPNDGYLEETKGWTYKIGVGEHFASLL